MSSDSFPFIVYIFLNNVLLMSDLFVDSRTAALIFICTALASIKGIILPTPRNGKFDFEKYHK